jgi:hypothetical protein
MSPAMMERGDGVEEAFTFGCRDERLIIENEIESLAWQCAA